jgi:hypothetical protein
MVKAPMFVAESSRALPLHLLRASGGPVGCRTPAVRLVDQQAAPGCWLASAKKH